MLALLTSCQLRTNPDDWQIDPYGPGRIVLLDMLVQHVHVISEHSLSSLEVGSNEAPQMSCAHVPSHLQ